MSKSSEKRRHYDENLLARGARLAWRVDEPVPFCWMCDRASGRRAREHVFPRWLLEALQAADEPFNPVHRDYLGRVISARGPIPAKALVAGEVCVVCNHGWMSALEAAVQPLLFPTDRRRTLSTDELTIIARWFAKTAVVLNTSQNYRLLVPREARHGLADGIPAGFAVYLGYHHQGDGGQLNFGQTSGAISVAPGDRVEAFKKEAEKVYGCGLAIGDLLGVVVYAPPNGWAWPTEPMVSIWPNGRGLDWSTVPTVAELTSALILAGQHPDFTMGGMSSEAWRQRAMGLE